MSQLASSKSAVAGIGSEEVRESVYQPTQPGLNFPRVPEFASHLEERQHRKERLVAACRAFALNGFDYGFAAPRNDLEMSQRLAVRYVGP